MFHREKTFREFPIEKTYSKSSINGRHFKDLQYMEYLPTKFSVETFENSHIERFLKANL